MIVQGIGGGDAIEVSVPRGQRYARVAVECESDGESAVVTVDANHLEALEAACRAARLELDARAVGP